MRIRRVHGLVLSVFITTAVLAGKAPPPVPPPSAMAVGTWTTSGAIGESFYFTPSQLSFQRSFTVPAGGAWLWGDARYSNFLEMDCDHHYVGTASPSVTGYSPLFTAGELPPPYDVCSFNNCYSCRLDWGGVKQLTYYTTSTNPAFVTEGTRVITISTLNGGGDFTSNLDNLNLWIAQENRSDMSSLTMFQAVADDDPTQAADTEVAARYFIANSADRVPVVPVFHGSNGDFPGGPNMKYTAKWDDGTIVDGEESAPKIANGLTVIDVPIPKLATGSHTFTLTSDGPNGKKLTTAAMTVFVYAQSIYVTYGAFDPKNPVDDLPKIIPGADINGNDVDLKAAPQMLQLNILIGRGSSGSFEVHLRNVTHYPGIAMNYPISNPDTGPDLDFGAGDTDLTSVTIPKGGAPKVVKLPLYVHDYGAAATIEVTVPYKKTNFTAKRKFPLDDNDNGLPDAGWRSVGGVQITDATLHAADDNEIDPPAVGLPIDNILGDGVSAYEEYRGFYVAGGHIRLDPNRKKVFVVPDSSITSDAVATNYMLKLPFRVLPMDTTEVKGFDNFSRSVPLIATRAEVDPNRAGVPGARSSGHRAVRLVFGHPVSSVWFDAATSTVGPLWQRGIAGITWADSMPEVDFANSPSNVPQIESPDQTQFVEVMTQAAHNYGIGTDFTDPGGYHDLSGTQVQPCGVAPPGTPCDDWDLTRGLIVPHAGIGGFFVLHTVVDPFLHPADFYSSYSFTCGIPGLTESVGRMTASDEALVSYRTMIHEMGHNLQLEHATDPLADCHNIMYDNRMAPPNRRTFLDIVPLTNDYSTANRDHMRLWQP